MSHLANFRYAWSASLGLHLLLFAAGLAFATAGPHLEVTTGRTSIALVFRAAPSQPVPVPKPAVVTIPKPLEPVRPAEPLPSSIPSVGVEATEVEYSRNPPPAYPREAYLQNIQGTVWVLADVDARGRPLLVVVERSSGSSILDHAATNAVRGWLFTPASRFGRPITSRCRIPIHFQIKEPT